MPRILLLDGYSLLFRAFFAMRALTTKDGQPTNALYGLTLMSLTLLDNFKPDGVVCAFDTSHPTFRHDEFDVYKAHRKPTPEELKLQSPIARDLVRSFGFQSIEKPGFEADDVIGTLAEILKKENHEVFIVTGDMDSLQLVDDNVGPVRVVSTIKGVTETIVYDVAAVEKRCGLTPAQIADMKGLKGDASDNLPGVPGIGDKTATKLLLEYQSVENLYAKLDQMSDLKLKAKLEPFAEQVVQVKRLATIIRDVPMDDVVIQTDYQERGADMDALKPLFDRLEFKTLLKRFPGSAPEVAAPKQVARNYEAPQNSLAFDFNDNQTERPQHPMFDGIGVLMVATQPLDKVDLMTAEPSGLALSKPGAAPEFVAWLELTDEHKAMLSDETIPKVTYNSKLLIGVLNRYGITVRGVVFDVLLAAYLINSSRSSYPFAGIVSDFLGHDPDSVAGYGENLRALEPIMRVRLKTEGTETIHDTLELPLSAVIGALEQAGVTIDPGYLVTLGGKMAEAIKEVENEIFNLAGVTFAIGSTKQLQDILFDRLGLPPSKKTKTGYSTDAEVLEGLADQGHEIAAKIIQWREVNKLKSTYVDALPGLVNPVTGKVHTTLSQTVASTGRLSSSNPNLQNIPVRTAIGREIRKAFVTGPGCELVSADYSQIELRIFAHVTNDPELLRTFAADEDIHTRTASLVFGVPEADVTKDQRGRAKTINFAVIYGMSAFRLASELGVSQPMASEWRKLYFENYKGVKEYSDNVLEIARERGYVTTLLGRRRYVPDITSRVFQFRQAAEREAVNMTVQGTAADVIKLAMLGVDKALKDEGFTAKMVLQVHDELLFESPESESDRLAIMVKREMESAYDLGAVPIRADVKKGKNWSEMTKIVL